MNLTVGILQIGYHQLLMTLQRQTESRGMQSNPPKTYIYWDQDIETAEWVHLDWFILATGVHFLSPYQYFSTEFRQCVPSNPPIAYMPSARTAAARARRGWFMQGSCFHFYEVGSKTQTDLRGWLSLPPKPPMAYILFLLATTESQSLASNIPSFFFHSLVVRLRVYTVFKILSPSLPPIKQRRSPREITEKPLLFLPIWAPVFIHLFAAILKT